MTERGDPTLNSKPPAGDENFDQLTAARLRELLHYDPMTGAFIWRVPGGCCRAGDVAGQIHRRDGYCRIQLEGKTYRAHRLAWFYVTGAWPQNQIDHRNRERADNRWCNLREATHSQNHANSRCRSASGFKGVSWNKACGKWKSQIRGIYLGVFDTKEAASAAYCAAAQLLFGDFARGQ